MGWWCPWFRVSDHLFHLSAECLTLFFFFLLLFKGRFVHIRCGMRETAHGILLISTDKYMVIKI